MAADSKTPAWGIEPVPERLRVLGFFDTAALWGSLGVSLLVLVAGTYLVPALSLRDALIAIAVGGLIGNLMLGTAGAIGAQARVPAMVLMRPSLGRRGSYAATALNVVQNLGWAIFELIVIATAAAALSDQVFGFEGKWLWTVALRAAHGRDGAGRADRRRAPLRPPLRALGRARVARLPHVVDDRQRRPRRVLVAARRRRVGVVRHRPHDRPARLVAAADRRLHALLARQAVGVRRLRDRLSRPECLALRSRRRARAHEPGVLRTPTRPS